MLGKFLEITDAPAQAQYLTQVIEMCAKNSQELVAQLTQDLVSSLIGKGILNGANFIQWLELSINLLSIQQCFQYAPVDQQPTTPALKLLDAIGQLKVEEKNQKHEKINTLLGKYSTIELSLVMHSFLARHCVSGISVKKLPRLMPIFIKLSSFIIQKYFQLKNQPNQGSNDKIDDDQVILNNCEKWLSKNIEHFFRVLPQVKDPLIKSLVLLATSDIIGALLETDRQNLLDKDLTLYLQEKVLLGYCRRNYTHNEIYSLFMKYLRNKGFSNPLSKIQIPEIYSQQTITKIGPSAQAFTYIIVRLVKSSLLTTESDTNLLKLLIPAVSQVLIRSFEIKVEALQLLQSLLKKIKPIKMSTCFQFGYPIQLFFFYLYQCEKENYEHIRNCFLIESQEQLINSLLVLQDIFVETLQKEKLKYIMHIIEKNQLYSERVLIFARKIRFKEEKAKRQVQLLDIVGKIRNKNEKGANALLKVWKETKNEMNWIDPSVKSKIEELGI